MIQNNMSTITTIQATDNISDSRAVINTNISNLNTDKLEASAITGKEDTSNKKTTLADNSDTFYPSQKAVKTAIDAKQDSLGFTAENSANKKTTLADNSDTYYPSQKAVKTAVDAKQDTLVSATNIKTINGSSILGSGDLTVTGSGASLWTAPAGATRASNTTFTVTGDQTAIFKKGLIIKWTESSTVRCAMVSIPSTVSTNTTVTIIGDTMASIDSNSLKYCLIGAEKKLFAVAGTIGATATGVANTITALEPYRVIGADLWVGTAGTTNNTTVDININGSTFFTTNKPTLATTVQSSPTPYTADTTTALALGDDMTLDIDAIQTTAAIDLYVMVYLFPSRYLTLS